MKKCDAIFKVLEDAGQPLHYTVIAYTIKDQNLYQSASQNWNRAVNSDCSKIVRSKEANSSERGLYRHSRGFYGLSKWKRIKKHEAIRMVLKDADRPLSVEEITDAMQIRGLYYTTSKNPVNAVGADLSKIIRVEEERGAEPWVYRESPGVYGLTEWKKEKNSDP
ncbi:MAG TPA: HTH domain-containing protein [Methanoregulaceae archaeon]|nr:HTH domain-containing protein [Methanoregulaceae archaeon]